MKKTGIIIAAIVVLFAGVLVWSLNTKRESTPNYDEYNIYGVIGPNRFNGEIGDNVKGNPEAKVLIFEYADYQCPGCAAMWPRLSSLLDDYEEDEVALVYRNFLLSYHQNGTAAASAAEAAAKQGCWEKYADLLFTNQTTWEYSGVKERGEIFRSYFVTASDGKGDVEQFERDMVSSEVKKKIEFDMGLAKKVNVEQTPTIIIGEEKVDFAGKTNDEIFKLFKEKIDSLLEK